VRGGKSPRKRDSATHRQTPYLSGRVPAGHVIVVVVVVSFCGKEGGEVVVVVVTSLRGGGGEEEEKEIQPDRDEAKNIPAISFCSMGGLPSPCELAPYSGAREAIFLSLSKSREECGALCARYTCGAVNGTRRSGGAMRGAPPQRVGQRRSEQEGEQGTCS
jgi:hypothetical protein